MKKEEKQEIAQLPQKYRPMGAWKYFGYSILFGLPLIGFIALIVCAFSSKNIVRRSYARSFFCAFLIVAIIFGIIIGIGIGTGFFAKLPDMIPGMTPEM